MPNWKKTFRAAVDDAAQRQRSPKAQNAFRRFAAAHERPVASLFAAYADGLIDKSTFTNELRDEKQSLAAELRASKLIPKASIGAAANALFTSLDDALKE